MSAILAIYNRNREPIEPAVVGAMLDASVDRAVDGQASWVQGHVALAHQHFWVTPEEQNEQQPLVQTTGRLAVTADVRLDNRAELIGALKLEPVEDRLLSDAELLLHAYEQWGTDCVDRLLGDFAFALWDAALQKLFVARDALGMRGISYYVDHNHCLVASEIKQILAHPAVEPALNEGKVAEYLVALWNNQEETFYESIYYCPPGHCLLVSAGAVRRWSYWDLDPHTRLRYERDDEYAEHFRALLEEAVRCRLRVRGSIGISLSGGLDSTSVAAVASTLAATTRPQQSSLNSFSYVFDELSDCDERPFIQPVTERYGLDATYILGDDKWTLRNWQEWPVDQDFVYHDAYVWLPLAVVEAAGRAGCRLLLTGHFGDMLFAGASYWAADLLRELRFAQFLSVWDANRSAIDWRKDLLAYGLRPLIPAALRSAYRRLWPRPVVWPNRGLHPDLANRTHLVDRSVKDQRRSHFSGPGRWPRYRSLTSSAHPQGMAAARRLYTIRGVERADPYTDRRLVEYAMAIPADQLGRPGRTRWVQRNAMVSYLPEAVRERSGKTSYLLLFERGVRHREQGTVRALLKDAQILQRRFVRADWLSEKLELDGDRAGDDYALWLYISLELWLRRYW